jgi:hypothetical protein
MYPTPDFMKIKLYITVCRTSSWNAAIVALRMRKVLSLRTSRVHLLEVYLNTLSSDMLQCVSPPFSSRKYVLNSFKEQLTY